MRQFLFPLLFSLLTFSLAASLHAQDSSPVPTLVPPTLVPTPQAETAPEAQPALSAAADIAASGILRVGVLYNDPPYSELTLRGEISGFDADLLRLMAAAWGSEIEFVQVTRLNALDKLNSGQVHAVASAIVHYRDLATAVDFSQSYLRGKQALLAAANSPYTTPAELSGQAIGYVLGSRSEKALTIWRDRLGKELNLRPYLTLDRGLAALTRSEIAGLVAEEQALLRLVADSAEDLKILDEPVLRESHAIAVKRQDAPMRQLLNRTLQILAGQGELDALYREYFPDFSQDALVLPLWSGIGEAASPEQFPAEIRYPAEAALPGILSRGRLRVAGHFDANGAATAGQKRLAELNRALVSEIAARWGVEIEMVAGAGDSSADLLSSGSVDLVVGVKPDWAQAGSLEYSAPYLQHGDRLMTRANSGIAGFNNLRGRIIGVLIGDPGARERAKAWADSINASVRFFQTTESGAAQTLLEHNNANAIYADSLALLAHLEANPNALRLTERWYSRSHYVFALPYNDPELRNLLNYTLQELMLDGALLRLSAPLMVADALPDFDVIPGFSHFAGLELAQREVEPGS